jgi:GAF domain-containing protein
MSQQHPQPYSDDRFVALGRTLEILREEENADVLIETTLDYLTREFTYRLIWIGLYDRLKHRLCGKGGATPTGETSLLNRWFNLHPGDVLEQVVIEQRPVGIPDLRQEVRAGEWRRAAEEFGIQGTLLFPLRCKDRCFGVALLGSHLWGVSSRPAEKAELALLLGGLAAALYQIEVEWQRSVAKRPDLPLFQVLDELMQVESLEQRLEAVVKMTQQFVTPTRTNLYWYSSEGRYFWHRLGNRQASLKLSSSKSSAPGLTAAEVNDFYEALRVGQLVAIGAGRSPLKSESTQRLLGRLRARSILAAPILVRGELLGFLGVEDSEPRIWEESESKYVHATAQLMGLVLGTEELEVTLEETQKNAHFAAEISQAIARSNDLTVALKNCAKLLCRHLKADRFLVLQEEENGQFTPVFGTQPLNRRPLSSSLPPVSPDDRQWLFNSVETVTIEDLELDTRLFQWRKLLQFMGVRSLLICQTSTVRNGDEPNSLQSSPLLLVGHGTARTWSRTQRELVSIVAQQINLLLLLERYTESAKQSLLAHQTLQAGLSTLVRVPLDPSQLEQVWLSYLADLLQCPLVALIGWRPESEVATIVATVASDSRFALPPDLAIAIARDVLIQDVLATRNFLSRSVGDLTASTRNWLNSPGIGQLLAIALHADAMPTTGILLLADREEQQWPRHLLPTLETLTQQFTWLRHYQSSLSQSNGEIQNLQILTWYKHRCLEILHQSVHESVSALLELEAKMLPLPKTEELNDSNPSNGNENYTQSELTGGQPLRQMHRQQLLHQLEQTLAVLTPVLKEEQWQLAFKTRPLPLASLLKRSLQRVESFYKQQQLRVQVHNSGNKSVYGDQLKLECVLSELLMTFGLHAQPGSWINLWCSPFSPEFKITSGPPSSRPMLELLISDIGVLDDCLNAFTSSPLPPPSINLKICQQILKTWGGDLQFYPFLSGYASQQYRYFGRLLLPLAH